MIVFLNGSNSDCSMHIGATALNVGIYHSSLAGSSEIKGTRIHEAGQLIPGSSQTPQVGISGNGAVR